LSFAINKVCQFLHAPRSPHWSAVKRILRYIQHTVSHGLHIRSATSSFLSAFSDADWAGSSKDRRSTAGHAIYYGVLGNNRRCLALVRSQNTKHLPINC
jgi:histone deacetylase 1/2